MTIKEPQIVEEGIFVYGSNEVARHFSGAAKTARDHYGAELGGKSFGIVGQSFGIPTKDALIQPLPLQIIKIYIDQFIKYSKKSHCYFMVTKVGTGLAGYTDDEIAPLFAATHSNCYFDSEWEDYLGATARDGLPRLYWGSYDK